MNFVLNLKQWQIFILLTGLPIVMLILSASVIINDAAVNTRVIGSPPDFTSVIRLYQWLPYLSGICIVLVFLWYSSILQGLQIKMPNTVISKVKLVHIIMIFTLGFAIACLVLLSNIMIPIFESFHQSITEQSTQNLANVEPSVISTSFKINFYKYFVAFLACYFLSIFGTFFIIYQTAKIYKTAELKRKVKFKDFIGEFFLFGFYFIGIWILQPKINKLIENQR